MTSTPSIPEIKVEVPTFKPRFETKKIAAVATSSFLPTVKSVASNTLQFALVALATYGIMALYRDFIENDGCCSKKKQARKSVSEEEQEQEQEQENPEKFYVTPCKKNQCDLVENLPMNPVPIRPESLAQQSLLKMAVDPVPVSIPVRDETQVDGDPKKDKEKPENKSLVS